jgi:DivIVA domain-containing protein
VAAGPGWFTRLWQLIRPPLPTPLTASLNTPNLPPAAEVRRNSLARLEANDVRNVRFSSTKFREGYSIEEVDVFLDRVERHLRTGGADRTQPPLTAEAVIDQRFSSTKLRPGYDQDEVDDFLDRIVTELRRER